MAYNATEAERERDRVRDLMLREALDWIDAGLGNQWFHLRCMVGTFVATGGKGVFTIMKTTKK